MERTLLFIDPDPATRLLVERVLSPEGFSVLHAETALEGQEFAARILPDLILVDVDRARAADLVPALRRCPGLERVRLLASTAHAWPDHLEKMLALGFDRALVEPLDIDTLAQELRECLPGPPPAVNGTRDLARDRVELIPSPAHAGNGVDGRHPPGAVHGPEVVADAVDVVVAGAHAPDVANGLDAIAAADAGDTADAPAHDATDALDAAGAPGGMHALLPAGALDAADPLAPADRRDADDALAPGDVLDRAADQLDHRYGIEPTNGTGPVVEREETERQASQETAPTASAEAVSAAPLPAISLEPVEVPSLWRLGLTPLTAALVRATGATDGLLALLTDEGRVLVIVAGASNRQVDDGTPVDAGVPIGTRVLAGAAPWIEQSLRAREATVLAADAVGPSPLVPSGSQALLVVPVASRDSVRGVAVLGKHHPSRAVVFGSGKVAAAVSQGRQIAAAVEVLRELDRASGERRRELERVRAESARAVLKDVTSRARRSRRNGAGAEPGAIVNGDAADRLGAALAERLGLTARQREVLAQALPVRDIGKDWLERVLLHRTTLSVAERARVLEASAEHGAEILSALGWPPAVVKLVRLHRASWNGAGWPAGLSGSAIPVEARIMAVVSAFAASAARRAGEDEASVARDVVAELSREAGRRFDPAVVDALNGLALSDEGPTRERG